MRRNLLGLVTFLALLAARPGRASAQGSDPFEPKLRQFLDEHCASCHGPEVQKRRLRFDRLPSAFGDKDVAATWVKVLDKLSNGEMPPKDRPRPPEDEARAVVAGLRRQLHDASLDRQRREGRVALRRLNRTEYETTLRDLLATPVDVKDLLPDDNIAAGFDNVSAVLDISPAHLLRYQDAAEKSVRAVIPKRPRVSIHERRTGRQITEKLKLYQELLGKSVRLDGDTLVLYLRNPDYIPCATPPAPADGRYRVRVCASAVNTGGKPLPMMCVCRPTEYDREDTDVRTVRDVPAGKPTVIEEEFDLRQRQVMVFAGWSLPDFRAWERLRKDRKLDGDPGLPGLAVHWIEIEGPLGPWPPDGYRRLFDGVPLKPQSVAKREAAGQPVPPQHASRPDGWWQYDPIVPAPAKPRRMPSGCCDRSCPGPSVGPSPRNSSNTTSSLCTRPSTRASRSPRRWSRPTRPPSVRPISCSSPSGSMIPAGLVAPSWTTMPSPRGCRISSGRRCPIASYWHWRRRAGCGSPRSCARRSSACWTIPGPDASPPTSPANGSTCATSTPPRRTPRSTASSTTSCSGRCRARRNDSSKRSSTMTAA